jgi:hypothetical protein
MTVQVDTKRVKINSLYLYLFKCNSLDPTNNRNCVKCAGHCPKKCRGDENIDSAGAALKFRNCNIIDGYLEIEIRIGNEAFP